MTGERTFPKPSARSGGDYDIMGEVAWLGGFMRDGLPFLKPGLQDIAVVVLATSLIEKFLRVSLIALFKSDVASKTMIDGVFTGKGPLATFSAKIEVCAGLGNISADVRHDLKIINKIRNGFAHSPHQLFLKDVRACSELKLRSGLEIQDDCLEREKFKHSCASIVAQLSIGTLFKIAAERFLSANKDGVAKEYEAMIRSLDGGDAQVE
ncbi:MAG: MltR family transcriptional regulator [Bradyrhizobium sp.]